jgi:acetoin utilization deacetylase AcuC-like enzyme
LWEGSLLLHELAQGLVVEQAKRLCSGGAVFVLEGGYDLRALSEGVANVLKALR